MTHSYQMKGTRFTIIQIWVCQIQIALIRDVLLYTDNPRNILSIISATPPLLNPAVPVTLSSGPQRSQHPHRANGHRSRFKGRFFSPCCCHTPHSSSFPLYPSFLLFSLICSSQPKSQPSQMFSVVRDNKLRKPHQFPGPAPSRSVGAARKWKHKSRTNLARHSTVLDPQAAKVSYSLIYFFGSRWHLLAFLSRGQDTCIIHIDYVATTKEGCSTPAGHRRASSQNTSTTLLRFLRMT